MITLPGRWVHHAACADHDPNLFFPEHAAWTQPRAICHSCPVKAPCLRYALRVEQGLGRHNRYGMFGGHTPIERAAMRKQP